MRAPLVDEVTNVVWQPRLYLAVHLVVALLPALGQIATDGDLVDWAAPALSSFAFIGSVTLGPALLLWIVAAFLAVGTRNASLILFAIADLAILVLHFVAALPEVQ